MRQVKSFLANSPIGLEEQVNEFLSEMGEDVIDVVFIGNADVNGAEYTAFVAYLI